MNFTEIRLAMLASKAGFAYKQGVLRTRTRAWGNSIGDLALNATACQGRVDLRQGATARVLDGSNVRRRAGTTVASLVMLGPFGLFGAFKREIAVEVTGADGMVLVATTPKKNTTDAHRFVGMVNSGAGRLAVPPDESV